MTVGRAAALVVVVVVVGATLVGCSDDRTPGAVRDAYAPLIQDALWTATPPGYRRSRERPLECLANIDGGTDEIHPGQHFTETGDPPPPPVEFYLELGAEEGWSTDGPTDGGTELYLTKEHDGARWSVAVQVDPAEEGIPASVDLSGTVAGVKICPEDG